MLSYVYNLSCVLTIFHYILLHQYYQSHPVILVECSVIMQFFYPWVQDLFCGYVSIEFGNIDTYEKMHLSQFKCLSICVSSQTNTMPVVSTFPHSIIVLFGLQNTNFHHKSGKLFPVTPHQKFPIAMHQGKMSSFQQQTNVDHMLWQSWREYQSSHSVIKESVVH